MGIMELTNLVQQLNTILNSWLNKNNFKCTVQFSDHFEYDYLNQIISYTLFEDGVNNELFLQICNSIYPYKYDIFIISFLHELGHYASQYSITVSDLEEKQKFEALDTPTEDEQLSYFVSFSEWEATTWACNYIKDNEDEIKKLSSLIEDIRVEFFNYVKEED